MSPALSLFDVACTPLSNGKSSLFQSEENLMGCEEGLQLDDCTRMDVFVPRIVSKSTRVHGHEPFWTAYVGLPTSDTVWALRESKADTCEGLHGARLGH